MNWYVIYTRPRWEKKIAKMLSDGGIENYCPLNKVKKQWSDRKKTVFEPLFKGYLFVRLEDEKKWEIKSCEGVLNFVYWLGKPAIVKTSEIEKIKRFLDEFEGVEVAEIQLKSNDRVMVNKGVFMDFKGIVIEVIGNKARVLIESMGLQLTAVFDKNSLVPLLK